MAREHYEEVRRDAYRALLDAQAALDAARRRVAVIATRLEELRSRKGRARLDDRDRDRRQREASDAVEFARERDRRGHERAARLHDHAAARHEATAELYDGEGNGAGAARERAASDRERRAAEKDRRAQTRAS